MQETSALYKQLVSTDGHWFECKLVIEGVGTLGETELFHIETDNPSLQGKPTIGSAPSGEIDVELLMPETAIPKMAKITPYFRAVGKIPHGGSSSIVDGKLVLTNASIVNDKLVPSDDSGAYVDERDMLVFPSTVYVDAESEWLPHGVYYVDTREESEHGTEKTLVIHGYDAMLMFEQDYPNTNHAWPYTDIDVIDEMCQTVDVDVDPRTYQYLTAGLEVQLPTGYSMREILEQIAGAYCGNFIMSAEGKLLFVPLYGFEPDVNGNYLADQSGNALVFGEEDWFILV